MATVQSRLGAVLIGTAYSTYGPTTTHAQQLTLAEAEFEVVRTRLNTLTSTTIPALEAAIVAAAGPWTPGAPIPALQD